MKPSFTEPSVQMPDGCTIWTRKGGRGPGMLLCHGGPGLWDYLEPVEPALSDLVTLVRFDQRGCGRSSRVGPYTVEQYAADIETIREYYGYESWIVGGHSWGATLALAYAWAHPERTGALVYISGTGLGSLWHQAHTEAATQRLTLEHRQRYAELREKELDERDDLEFLTLSSSRDYIDRSTAMAQARAFHEAGYLVNMEANRALAAEVGLWSELDSVSKCRALNMPALVLHGSLDTRPSWASDSLVEALPNVRRIILDGAGHLLWVDRPVETREALRSFLIERVLDD